MTRRELLKSLPLTVPAALLTACGSGVTMGSNLMPQYLVRTDMIRQELLPHFPFKHGMSGIGSLMLRNPVLGMAPEKNKVRLGMSLQASAAQGIASMVGIPALEAVAGQFTQGRCQVACGLRYDPKTKGIFLKDPEVEQLELDGIANQFSGQARSLVNAFGPQILNRYPVHTLEDSFATRRVKSLTVKKEGVAVGFGI